MIEQAIQAGKVASKARDLSLKLVKPGVKVLSVAESIEEFILKKGCGIAFPVNISVNEKAAHDTAMISDKRVFVKGDLVKVDVGVHVEGVVADTARTVVAGASPTKLVRCVNECLKKGVEQVRPGAKINSVGKEVQKVADSNGFSVVKNLVGHGLGSYNVHTGVTIPNYRNNEKGVFEEGMLVALEPYVTSGKGSSTGTNRTEIYSLKEVKPMRVRKARELVDWVVKERQSLPFCKRWLSSYGKQLDFLLKILVANGVLTKYPVLKEVSDGLVAQREDTVLVLEKPIVTTK